MAIISEFYKRLRDLCEERSMTVNELVKILDLSSGSPTAWKNGTVPRNATLTKLAEYFGVSTDYLLTGLRKGAVAAYSNGIYAYTGNTMQEIESKLSEREPGSFRVVHRGSGFVITVDTGSTPSDDQIAAVIAVYDPEYTQKEKAPTGFGERSVADAKAAFFDGYGDDLSEEEKDELWEDARIYAKFKAQQKK